MTFLLLWSSRFLTALPVLALVALVCVGVLMACRGIADWQECRRAHADKVHRDWERWHAQNDSPRDGGNLSTPAGDGEAAEGDGQAMKDRYRAHRRLLRRGPRLVRCCGRAPRPDVRIYDAKTGEELSHQIPVAYAPLFCKSGPFFARLFRLNAEGSPFLEGGVVARRLELLQVAQ